MMRLQNLYKDEKAIGFLVMGAILLVIFFIGGGIMMFFMVDMLIKNLLPIAIAIVLIICLPIAIKGWYYQKTGREYGKGG